MGAVRAFHDLRPAQRPENAKPAVEDLLVAAFVYSAALPGSPRPRDLHLAANRQHLPAGGASAAGGAGFDALFQCMERAARGARVFRVQLYRLVSGVERSGLDGRSGPADLLGLTVCIGLLEDAALAPEENQERLRIPWDARGRWARA